MEGGRSQANPCEQPERLPHRNRKIGKAGLTVRRGVIGESGAPVPGHDAQVRAGL
jgi:hypothetical protein